MLEWRRRSVGDSRSQRSDETHQIVVAQSIFKIIERFRWFRFRVCMLIVTSCFHPFKRRGVLLCFFIYQPTLFFASDIFGLPWFLSIREVLFLSLHTTQKFHLHLHLPPHRFKNTLQIMLYLVFLCGTSALKHYNTWYVIASPKLRHQQFQLLLSLLTFSTFTRWRLAFAIALAQLFSILKSCNNNLYTKWIIYIQIVRMVTKRLRSVYKPIKVIDGRVCYN